MSHKNKQSLVAQVEAVYKSLLAIGESKHLDKQAEDRPRSITSGKIYSWGTFRSYLKQACYFTKYCKAEHGCRNLDECREYVDEWLQKAIDDGKSPYTIKLYACALAKLYGCSTGDFIETPSRSRAEIKRSRGEAVRDSHFSEVSNADLVAFCRSTGLRRKELEALTGDKLRFVEGKYYISVENGKGGRRRDVLVIGDVDLVVRMMEAAGTGKVFDKVSVNADVHGYRHEYATNLYKEEERDLDDLIRQQKYYCRRDKKGVVYDKRAMLVASKALGHNRRNIISSHYLL